MNQSPAQTGLGWFGQHIWDHHQAADFKTHPTPLNSEFIVTFRHHDQMKHVWVEGTFKRDGKLAYVQAYGAEPPPHFPGWRFWDILDVTTAEEEKRPPSASASNPKTTVPEEPDPTFMTPVATTPPNIGLDKGGGKWEDKPPSKDTQGANLVSFPEASNASSPPAKPRKKPRQPRIAMGVFPDKKSKEIYLGLQAKVPQNHNRHWARPLSERHQQAELWPKQKRKALELGREK
ncbi:hypothetical protein SELMODRAFT_408051 [Selaginella moellendorffii]|uniref:Uncharacterized protein n=1 Tax=Selaginella moellendorffii TaxID=88036 RepID=D8R717_SELML|nr:hypothetical protein SELMODRAFT_408051 [Selaginella moellendorffii]